MADDFDERRMEVMRLDSEGWERQRIADELGVSLPTIFRDLRWLKKGDNLRDLVSRHRKKAEPLSDRTVAAALNAVQAASPVSTVDLVIKPDAGPQGPAERERAMDHASELWRLHVPDALVALTAFSVDGSLLMAWLSEGRRQILSGLTSGWEARLYLLRAKAFTDSLVGDGVRPGILASLFGLLESEDPKVVLSAAKLLHEQGAMRQYFSKPIEVRVTAEVPGEAVEGVGDEASGLAAALGLIGADA